MTLDLTSKLKKNIMMRIYGIWLLRRVAPMIFFEILFTILAAHLFSLSVFVVKVAQNAALASADHPFSLVIFLGQAFLSTRLEVKAEIFVALVMGALFIWSVKRAIVSYEMIRRTWAS